MNKPARFPPLPKPNYEPRRPGSNLGPLPKPNYDPDPPSVLDYLEEMRHTRRTAGRSPTPLADAIKQVVSSGLERKLHDQLLSKMKTPTCRSSMSKQRIISAYMGDMMKLDGQLDEFNEMSWALARNHIDFFEPTSAAMLSQPHASIEKEAHLMTLTKIVDAERGIMGISAATADLMKERQDDILRTVQTDVTRRVDVLAAHLVGSLIAGVKSGLYGIAVWPAGSSAWYVRNDHMLKATTFNTTKNSADPAVITHSYERWLRCNEVHLMDAVRLRGTPGWLDYPSNILEAVYKITPLLRPHVSTIVGTMIRKRQISWRVGTINVSRDVVLPQAAPVYDPAIAIGPIVLTGWEKDAHRVRRWWQRLRQTFARKME